MSDGSSPQDWKRHRVLLGFLVLILIAGLFLAYSSKTSGSKEERLLPAYIIVFGFLGSATYVGKTVGAYIGKGEFNESYIPYHLIRLVIGPSIAGVLYLILKSGSFFGITISLSDPVAEQYVFAAVAFMGGYFVRQTVEIISNIFTAVFKLNSGG